MSTPFELDQSGWAKRVADARASNFDANEELAATAGEGLFSGTGQGLLRGFARTVEGAGIVAGGTVGQALDVASGAGKTLDALTFDEEGRQTSALAPTETKYRDAIFETTDDVAGNAVDFWTPSSRDVGAIGRTLGGFAEIVGPLIMGGGSPSLLIGTSGIEGAKEMVDQGVDATTAVASGEIDALATAIGFKLPFLGKSLTSKMLTGALGNVLTGAGSTELQHELLGGRGYEELAQNYDPLDVQSRAIDLLTGLAFGGLDWASVRSADRTAAAAANNAKHFQQDTAPGMPQNYDAIAAHTAAMDQAFEQMIRGEPVSVDPAVQGAEFKERPPRAVEVPEELREFEENQAAADEWRLRNENLEIATRSEESVKPDESVASDEGYSVAEGELTDEQLAAFKGLRSDVPADQNVGGPGTRVPGEPRNQGDGGPRGEPLKVFRGSDRELSAEDFRPESLGFATSHPSSGLGVFFTNTAGHAAQYGRVSEHLLDIRNPKVVKVEDFPGLDSLDEYQALAKKLKAEGHDGMVIDASHIGGPVNYVAFDHGQVLKAAAKEKPAPKAKPAAKPTAKPAPDLGKLPEQVDVAGPADLEPYSSPALEAVRESLADRDVQVPTGELDSEGNAITRSAREALAEAEAGIAIAQKESVKFEAAVSCFLTQGAE